MKGYKVFNPDWTCQGFQYEVGKTYEMAESPILCEKGFHFCEKAADCFNYYSFNSSNKVAEIVAHGEIVTENDKSCTNKIEIARELTWHEVLDLVNTGKNCTGNRNSGNRNTGDCNSGNRNSGNRNTGDCNSGDCNSGDWNSGHWNTGDWNSGHWNSGHWNLSSYNTGCFNNNEHKIMFFDKPSKMTLREWRNSKACVLMNRIRLTEWINKENMTAEEKERYPEYKTTGGYLKVNNKHEACREWWSGLSNNCKKEIRDIPNFDAAKFKKITGIDVNK